MNDDAQPEAPALLARALTYSYRSGRRGLVDVDVEVRPGERVVVLGPNGSGKSTLVQLLAGLLGPGSGTATVLGLDPVRRCEALRGRLGVALDRAAHWEALTGRENAELLGRACGLGRTEARARAGALLARLGLEADVAVSDYSLGMKRRLLLAEALAHAPEVVLMDEPTLGLDPSATEALAALLQERAAQGAAALSATNDVHAAPLLAERVVFLKDGRKVADASAESLLAGLRARTRIEVTLAGGEAVAAGTTTLPGILRLRIESGVLVAESERGAEPLPDLLRWLLERGAAVRDVRLREPDLGDAFREITGETLEDGKVWTIDGGGA